jgi:hypothetical protein
MALKLLDLGPTKCETKPVSHCVYLSSANPLLRLTNTSFACRGNCACQSILFHLTCPFCRSNLCFLVHTLTYPLPPKSNLASASYHCIVISGVSLLLVCILYYTIVWAIVTFLSGSHGCSLLPFIVTDGIIDCLGNAWERSCEKAHESSVILSGLMFHAGGGLTLTALKSEKTQETAMQIFEWLLKEIGPMSKACRVCEQVSIL